VTGAFAGARLRHEREQFGPGDGDGGGLSALFVCNILSQFAAYSVAWRERLRLLKQVCKRVQI
jgi:hypothetical protein